MEIHVETAVIVDGLQHRRGKDLGPVFPAALARYSAMSASRSSSSGVARSPVAIPMLAVTVRGTSLPAISNGGSSAARIRSATASATPGRRGPLGQHDELVATEASDGVALTQHLGQSGADLGQELIARPVTQGVVDVLEVVEVEEERSGVVCVSSGPRHHLGDPVEDQCPIG